MILESQIMTVFELEEEKQRSMEALHISFLVDPDTAAPGKAALGTAAPDTAAPSKAAPGTAAPSKAAPGTAAPSKAAPDKAVHGKTTPGKVGPSQAAADKAVLAKTTPGKVGPGKAALDKAVPDKSASDTAQVVEEGQSNGDDNFVLPPVDPPKSNESWSVPETGHMLRCYAEYLPKVGGYQSTFKNKKQMWMQIAEDVNGEFSSNRTWEQCKTRLVSLNF